MEVKTMYAPVAELTRALLFTRKEVPTLLKFLEDLKVSLTKLSY
ncbi:hypothetical protein MY3296_001886 [Beauveria thailandica]